MKLEEGNLISFNVLPSILIAKSETALSQSEINDYLTGAEARNSCVLSTVESCKEAPQTT